MTIADAFIKTNAKHKEAVMESTWGHLAPKPDKSYKGFVVFAIAIDGLYCLIDYGFEGLEGSPWLYDVLQDFIGENAKEEGSVYRFDGVFRNYEFNGTVREVSTDLHNAAGCVQSRDDAEPEADIAICSTCRGRFRIDDCKTAYEDGDCGDRYMVHLCPVCSDGGDIKDYGMSEGRQADLLDWLQKQEER